MANTWFLQANPKLYDIDAAVQRLDRIRWRVPQYTSELAIGDVVLFWRSGPDAGIVGVGRVAWAPQLQRPRPEEAEFVRDPSEATDNQTRALVTVKPVEFVSKERVREIPSMLSHQVITAPMGTVFPVSDEQWNQLKPLIAEPPPVGATASPPPQLPPVFAWEQRAKSVSPMPGGYRSYLESLRTLLDAIEDERPTMTELPTLFARLFDVSERRGALAAAFLTRIGLLERAAGAVVPSEWSRRWQSIGDARIPIAVLHSRVRFIGEMLRELATPKTPAELLAVANEKFDMSWDTIAQINRRRGWLASAGMLAVDEGGVMEVTEAGRTLATQLTLYEPVGSVQIPDSSTLPPSPEQDSSPSDDDTSVDTTQLQDLIQELKEASTASADPNRFEQAVESAFAYLGFEAQWLGGSGKTDVLLDAPLGRDLAYRVIVDCKTSGAGSVTDINIDWMTLREHKAKHDADFVALVVPLPKGQRLFQRAEETCVTVLSADQLIALCRQHAKAPLGLLAYRNLFETFGAVDTASVSEAAEDWLRLTTLARVVVDALRTRAPQFGSLSARDLVMILADNPAADGATEDEVRTLLDTLSSPVVGVLERFGEDRFYVAMTPQVIAMRLERLGGRIVDDGVE